MSGHSGEDVTREACGSLACRWPKEGCGLTRPGGVTLYTTVREALNLGCRWMTAEVGDPAPTACPDQHAEGLRGRIARLARIWDEESLESPEEFADAVLAELGLVECESCNGEGVRNGVECEVCRTTGLLRSSGTLRREPLGPRGHFGSTNA